MSSKFQARLLQILFVTCFAYNMYLGFQFEGSLLHNIIVSLLTSALNLAILLLVWVVFYGLVGRFLASCFGPLYYKLVGFIVRISGTKRGIDARLEVDREKFERFRRNYIKIRKQEEEWRKKLLDEERERIDRENRVRQLQREQYLAKQLVDEARFAINPARLEARGEFAEALQYYHDSGDSRNRERIEYVISNSNRILRAVQHPQVEKTRPFLVAVIEAISRANDVAKVTGDYREKDKLQSFAIVLFYDNIKLYDDDYGVVLKIGREFALHTKLLALDELASRIIVSGSYYGSK